ncbi:23S rRNA (uracil(1939)-C(5))-methyltransferase RlmD [Alkanindiges illinoisensis]|uniref:23S rRNA (uracil(1939)-C(5))-methyltransferase RlmD n=1 Tax=Alkanindiges illinoisensis TaxID=197183 RepID=UPI000478EA19|nr:23S rRNA (uracil(1939)-C(5))-methyltransferase RlmD [Alkanindiges illinoisensis]
MRRKQREKQRQQPSLTFNIEALSHEGRGISHYATQEGHPIDKTGKKVFVAFALPGETVNAQVHETHKKYEEADCEMVLANPSPDRIEPVCPHFGICGGCSLQHMHPDAQIRFKHDVLASHFQHFGGLEPEQWLPPLRSTRTDYRRKARLGVRWVAKKDRMLVGFRERKSSYLTDLNVCKVLDAQIGERLEQLKQLLIGLAGRENISQLEMAIGDEIANVTADGQAIDNKSVAMIVRHLKPLIDSDVQQLLAFAHEVNWQLYLQPEGYDSVHRIDQPDAPMRLYYELPDFNVRFAFSPLDFTQVNRDMNRQMVTLACDLLDLKQGERVLDLFCGLGNFSLPLARRVGPSGQVVAVEGSSEMVARGFENAALNGMNNLEFYAQDLTKDFSYQPWAAQGFDALLIDPPRSGAEEVMHYLPKFNARRIVYVSCNPATLARDAGILAQSGYRMKKAGVMDMFTHTGHVESIALFEKS